MSWIAVKAFHREPKIKTPSPTEPSPQASDGPAPQDPAKDVSPAIITPAAPRPLSDIQLRLQQSYSPDAESGVKKILQEELKVDDLPALIKSSHGVR